MSVLITILVALHLLGMATIVGTFFAQLRAKDRFSTGLVLGGAITQLVTGIALIGLLHGNDGFNWPKYITHAVIGLVILGAAIGAQVAKSKHARIAPWFHTAGGLAVVNLLIAVLWRSYA
ncbi:MAG: hypothetical protein BGO95_05555 [Micrococcales bacterium 73-13]|nr:MAG: hypothetical protein BGO95_05555 [Micrococcales bacterium 73-13]